MNVSVIVAMSGFVFCIIRGYRVVDFSIYITALLMFIGSSIIVYNCYNYACAIHSTTMEILSNSYALTTFLLLSFKSCRPIGIPVAFFYIMRKSSMLTFFSFVLQNTINLLLY